MKKIVKLTESDLERIVRRVIKEEGFRAKFENLDYWMDDKGNYVTFDPDLERTGYYDFDYDKEIEIEDIDDMPEDIRKHLFGLESGKKMYDAYKNRYGKFRYARKKY